MPPPWLPFRASIILLAALIRSGPSAAQGYYSTDPAGRQVSRRCQPARYPKALPSAASLVDTAAVLAMVRRDPTDVRFSVAFTDAGTIGHLALLGADGAVQTAGPVTMLLRRFILPQAPGAPWAIRLQLIGEPGALVRVERATYCPPQQIDMGEVGGTFRVTIAPGERPPRGGRVTSIVELSLDSGGLVQKVELVQASGIRDFDDRMLQTARSWRFFPALIDGVGVASWVRSDRRRAEY